MRILSNYRLSASALLLFLGGISFAQTNPNMTDQQGQTVAWDSVKSNWLPSLVRDGAYDRTPHVNKVLHWAEPREADVMYRKRIWREIDIRQKQNMPFRFKGDEYSGGGMFIEIITDAVKKGKIKAYSATDDRFTTTMTKDQIMEMLQGKPETLQVPNPDNPDEMMIKIINNDFNPDLITRFRLKEDWFFDRNLGRMVVRIIGIAPLLDKYNEESQQYMFSYPMFWLHYPELREVLARYEVFNPENEVARMTWDEFFENRYFASYIIKTSNPFDATLATMGLQGTDALYEGQRISEEIFNKEHDMWVY